MKNQLLKSFNCQFGNEFLQKKEVIFLTEYLFDDEEINSLIVAQSLEKIYLVCLTNQRLFLIKKNSLGIFDFVRYGLEEVIDIKLKRYFENTYQLELILLENKSIFLEGINLKKATIFGKHLATAVQ